MKEIDWSKAPEGATHYTKHPRASSKWLRMHDDGRSFWDGDQWRRYTLEDVAAEHFALAVPRPWTGTGLPPVGTMCEACWTSPEEYYQVGVLAHDDGKAVCRWLTGPGAGELFESEDGILAAFTDPHPKFRPLRTPEQIAAEERERAISEMLRIYTDGAAGHCGGIAALYDAGYRRQEPSE